MESAPLILAALDRCRGLEANVKDGLRLRLNMAAGQLGEAARDALELARREQVGRGRPITLGVSKNFSWEGQLSTSVALMAGGYELARLM